MSSLVLPSRVEKEILRDKWVQARAEHKAQVMAQLDFDDPVCKEWRRELKKLDPLLSMGRGKAGADLFPVREGFFHIVRFNETAPVSVMPPITQRDGVSFAYPDSGELEALKRADLQDPRVVREQLEARAGAEEVRRVEAEEHKLLLGQEARERWRAASETSVSMAGRWSQNASGKRGRRS